VTSIDVLKALLAQKLSSILTESKLALLSKVAGIAIILFGVVIIAKELI
jgi:hypothetical protein